MARRRKKKDVPRFQPDVSALLLEARDVLGLTAGATVNHLLRLAACTVLNRPADLRALTKRTDDYRLRRMADKAAEAARAQVMASAGKPAARKPRKPRNWREALRAVKESQGGAT